MFGQALSYIKINKIKVLVVIIITLLGLFWFSLKEPLFNNSKSKVLLDSNQQIIGVKIAKDEQWRLTLQTDVPDKYKKAVMLFEDEYFNYHMGVNPISLVRALWQYIESGRIVSGGSTISMQVIRLSRGNKARTIKEKLIEIVLATRLECSYSKKEILKMYASNAPFGGNIVGLEAASWKYFRRSPHDLSWSEASLLAVLPNAPSLIFPGKNTDKLQKKRNRLIDKLHDNNIIDSLTCLLAKQEPINKRRYAFPHIAPHLLERAARENKDAYIHSSIKSKLQNTVNSLLNKHSSDLQANGINNMAALVIGVNTGNIIAYVGNSEPKNSLDNANMVDLITAQRSSGSIIKPMLYALLQDKGYILPNTLIADTPIKFGSYAPKNFSLRYDGAVPASDALARSLNIPSVKMLQIMTYQQFYDYLPKYGLTSVNKGADHYGLSIVLGGAEVRLEEVASAYAGMARIINHYNTLDGMYLMDDFKKASYNNERPKQSGIRYDTPPVISAAASWLTFKALLKVRRPEQETGWDSFLSANKIAWKTGTSFGFRDAWAVGVTPKYVVAVWAGNADGEGRPGLLGVKAAAPLMFDIFSKLPRSDWFAQPVDEMERIRVCKHSGYRASQDCASIDTIWAKREGLKTKACPYCKLIHLDKTGKYRVNSQCEEVSNMIHKSYFVLPPVMEWYYKKVNPYYKRLPPYRHDCKSGDEMVMQIIYPEKNTEVFIPREMGGIKGQLIFEAAHSDEAAHVHWHIDNDYIATTVGKHQVEVAPMPGKHTLRLIDDDGNTIKREFIVK